MHLFWECLPGALPDSHIILGGQPTIGSVVAIESVFQVNVGLPDEVIGTHEVMVEYGHSQLWFSWEGDTQLQDPGQEGKVLRTAPCPQRRPGMAVSSPCHSCLGKKLWSQDAPLPKPMAQPHSPKMGLSCLGI